MSKKLTMDDVTVDGLVQELRCANSDHFGEKVISYVERESHNRRIMLPDKEACAIVHVNIWLLSQLHPEAQDKVIAAMRLLLSEHRDVTKTVSLWRRALRRFVPEEMFANLFGNEKR